MGSLERFIHFQNLILFRKQLDDPRLPDEQRRQLLRLLKAEEANDCADEKGRPEHIAAADRRAS